MSAKITEFVMDSKKFRAGPVIFSPDPSGGKGGFKEGLGMMNR